jgi:hypothetical protein
MHTYTHTAFLRHIGSALPFYHVAPALGALGGVRGGGGGGGAIPEAVLCASGSGKRA